MRPDISIIVPVYNAEKTIQRCVESVLNQSCSSFELILVDDGSTDDSGKKCDHYSENDERIKVFHQKNKGVSEARNTGLAQVTGRYVCFLDSDDELYPDALKRYLELIRLYDADVLLNSLEVISKTGNNLIGFKTERLYEKEIWEEICLDSRPFGWAGGKMFKSDIINGIRFDKNMISQEDLDYNLEAYNRCRSVVTTPDAGYIYHHSATQRNPQALDYIKNQLKLLDYAEMNYQISKKAKKAVLERIAVLAYTALYNTTSRDEYDHLTNKICDLQELEKNAGRFKTFRIRHWVIMERMIRKDHSINYVYLRVRKKITKIVRMFKS